MSGSAIPVIDLGNSTTAAGRDVAARELDQAFSEVGFCYIASTGVEPALVDKAFEASQNFHALDVASKSSLAINKFHRGYMAPKTSLIRTSSVARVTKPNLSESFMMLHHVEPDAPQFGSALQGPNQWPSDLPGFRHTVESYNNAMGALARNLTQLIARALGKL